MKKEKEIITKQEKEDIENVELKDEDLEKVSAGIQQIEDWADIPFNTNHVTP